MRRATFIKIGKRLVQIGLPLALVFFFVSYVRSNWATLMSYKFQLQPALFALAFAGFLLQELSYGLIWRSVLLRLGFGLKLRLCLRIYLASEFVRYIPGNVWHVLTRIFWVGKYGVPRPIAFASMMVELITKLAAGALVFAVSLLFWDGNGISSLLSKGPLLTLAGAVLIAALLVGLHPRVLSGLLNTALRLVKREPVTLTMRYRDILLVTLAWCISWTIAGSAFYLLLLALWPAAPSIGLPICIGIYALAWDIGFIAFLTPSGLGFREGAIIGLFALAFPLPGGLAAILAVLSRLVSTLAELICVSLAYLGGGGGQQLRAVQQVQESLPPPSNEAGTPTMDMPVSPSEASTGMKVEGVVTHD